MKTGPSTTKLYIAGGFLLALALLVFVQAAFNLSPFINPSAPDQILLLYTLSTFIFLVLLVFGFVLSRTLIKVWIERKQQKPGSHFKTSLVVSLILLTLVPATLLFIFAFGLVNRSIDKWFSVPADQAFLAAGEITRQWRIEHDRITRGILNHLAQDPSQDLESVRRNFQLKGLMVIDSEGRVLNGSAEADIVQDRLATQILEELAGKEEIVISTAPHWINARRIDQTRILAAVFQPPARMLELSAAIATQRANYSELVQNRWAYRDTYVSILLLMTVLALFAAVWIGLFLSKRITLPIEALSEATREISAGNLDHRVDIKADDELGMLVRLFNDMAEQLQGTTRELDARRRYMEIILESIPTGVISLDADMRVNKINRAAAELFTAEQAITLDEVFTGEDLQAVQSLLRDAETQSVTREITFLAPGRPAHSAVTATRLTAGGFVLVVEDLTEVVRAQKASTWREVARRLAHEIKNPLTPIQLSAERISRNVLRLPAANPRVAKVIDECVEAIVLEVTSLKNLVDEFVRFARLPAVSRVPNSMHELINKTLALYEGRLNGVNVTLNLPESLPPILMDTLQMKRVLVNLIDNALEALSGEPLQELKIECELARDGTMTRLTISDTGRGIAPENRERLFTPYFSTRKNGTGLGLAISSRIISDHGGYIGVEPNSPAGTRFVIELPVCQESSLSMTSPASGSR
jgi:nitrogen fixation/metabolism regulation signal transduction histidine kinase